MKPGAAQASDGDTAVTWDDVFALQAHLKGVARQLLHHEGHAGSVHTTQLVNSALKKLNPQGRDWQQVAWVDREAFFKDAFHAMRRVLIDYARRRQVRAEDKVGGFDSALVNPLLEAGKLDLDRLVDHAAARTELADAVDQALAQLDRDYPGRQLALIVQFRSFSGLSQLEIARIIGISDRAVRAREKLAYASLRMALAGLFSRSQSPASIDEETSLQENEIQRVESRFPSISSTAFAAARAKVLASGQSVLQSEAGFIYEVFPDGRKVTVKQIEPPTSVLPGTKITIP